MKRSATPIVHIRWRRYRSYRGAKEREFVLYLHEWDGKPFYWGKTRVSFGQKGKRTGRYGSGYRHWIEGCLRHGGRLYIGEPKLSAGVSLEDVESFLITRHKPTIPPRPRESRLDMHLKNSGERPAFLPRSYPSNRPLTLP